MSSASVPSAAQAADVRSNLTRDTRLVFRLLEKIRQGTLEIRLPGSRKIVFGEGKPVVGFTVNDPRVFSQILGRGDIGFCESYLDGDWDCSDITGLLTLLAKNRDVLREAMYGSWFNLLVARTRHLLNRNSRAGSKRNIMAHYDLGNEFYKLWLDPSMTYSAAMYSASDDDSMESAQRAKHHRALERLCAEPGQSVLEIGCGWGAFAEMACREGLHPTGVTLSPAQLTFAQKRVPQADLRLQDYRDLTEQFDHVVSIEMFEAVGENFWPAYFKTVARALKPGGRAVIQSITIRDDLFANYRKSTDFIQQYIFPGGMLPSRSAFCAAAARQGLVVRNEYAFGTDYARTLAEWRNAFERNWTHIAALGFDEQFRRLWRMYLSYCEAGFLAGNIDVVQFELQHQEPRRARRGAATDNVQ